jgi:hypothetical protein
MLTGLTAFAESLVSSFSDIDSYFMPLFIYDLVIFNHEVNGARYVNNPTNDRNEKE